MSKKHFKTIWISDVHLGTSACRAEELRLFLKTFSCEKLYLVGDIIDGWALRRKWFWPSSHTHVVHQIMRKAEKEHTDVIYIAGNHDEFLRDLIEEHNLILGNIRILNEDTHITAKGKCLWVVHGDQYDIVLKHYKVVELFGDIAYAGLLWVNHHYDNIRRNLKMRRFSLINFIKRKVRMVGDFTEKFEDAVSYEASKQKFDGVISGHIHQAAARKINNVEYWNCGDWVESCTAIVETEKGDLAIVEWDENFSSDGKSNFILHPIAKVQI